MSRLQSYYDSFSRNFSLKWAIAYTLIYAALFCLGLTHTLAYFLHRSEDFYLFSGPVTLLLGLVGMWHGRQVIGAVRRRLAAKP